LEGKNENIALFVLFIASASFLFSQTLPGKFGFGADLGTSILSVNQSQMFNR
jgi:hypothetical protein